MKRNSKSIKQFKTLNLGTTTKLKLAVWKLRRGLRDKLKGRDILDVEARPTKSASNTRTIYRKVDSFIAKNFPKLVQQTPVEVAKAMVHDKITDLGYTIVEEDLTKPWGAYYRMADGEAERFINEFFPDLTLNEAKMGRTDVDLSPKFLLVAPGHRLSWQYHGRRAERWRFLMDGMYYRSHGDKVPKTVIVAKSGTVVQFDAGERHRLCANKNQKLYTLVAEIWQHTNSKKASDESDIVRLQDDYKR